MCRKIRIPYMCILMVVGLLAGAIALQSAPAAQRQKVNLNTATKAQLEALPGVGPELADNIIASRPFKSIDDLKNVSGIGEAKFASLMGLVTVETPKVAQATVTRSKAKSQAAARGTGKTAISKLVNLNTANKEALEALPGVGPDLADNIIASRPFKSVNDLKNVSGIGEAKFASLKGLVIVSAPGFAQAAEAQSRVKSPRGTQRTIPSGPVDINTAGKASLEALPGIGPELADKIIAARPFKSVDDLKNVQGIGEGRFDEIKNLVTVGEEEEDVSPKLMLGQTININSASQEELERLLGIGPVRARAIIEARPFTRIEDIMKVKGIKDKTFGKIRSYIVVR